MAIKIGKTLWKEIITAGEDVGFAICTECETIVSGHPELYDNDAPEIRCESCDIGTLEPTGDLIICGELVEDRACQHCDSENEPINLVTHVEDLSRWDQVTVRDCDGNVRGLVYCLECRAIDFDMRKGN